MSGEIEALSRRQTLVVLPRTQRVEISPDKTSQAITLLANSQRAVVSSDRTVSIHGNNADVKILDIGARGPIGPIGPTGPQGQAGTQFRFYGEGPPGTIVGSHPGDEYVDKLTGDLYKLL